MIEALGFAAESSGIKIFWGTSINVNLSGWRSHARTLDSPLRYLFSIDPPDRSILPGNHRGQPRIVFLHGDSPAKLWSIIMNSRYEKEMNKRIIPIVKLIEFIIGNGACALYMCSEIVHQFALPKIRDRSTIGLNAIGAEAIKDCSRYSSFSQGRKTTIWYEFKALEEKN